MTPPQAIGLIGLGVMGGAMARRLLAAGHRLHVHARRRDRAAAVLQAGAVWAEDVATLAGRCAQLFTIVGGPDDVAALYLGPGGLIAQAAPGACLVDMTTSSPGLAREIAERAAARGLQALDAPVTGGAPGAEAGTLSFMVGGEATALERVRPLLMAMGRTVFAMGPAGSGQLAKAANQIAVAGILLGLAEALAFAEGSGLDAGRVQEVLASGTAGGPLMQRLGPKMIAGDPAASFALDHFVKDLGIALDAPAGGRLAAAALCRELCREVAAAGGGGKGIQAVIEHYRRAAAR